LECIVLFAASLTSTFRTRTIKLMPHRAISNERISRTKQEEYQNEKIRCKYEVPATPRRRQPSRRNGARSSSTGLLLTFCTAQSTQRTFGDLTCRLLGNLSLTVYRVISVSVSSNSSCFWGVSFVPLSS
jgi:hypothetical protein